MNGRYLLDSNIVIALLAGEAGVGKSLGMADEVFLPSIAIGELKHLVHTKGRPLPENDIWIAAIARQHDLTLVTRDTHFAQIDNLNQTVG